MESTYALGGMGTNAIVPAWCPFSDGEKFIYSGMAKHVFIESKKGTPHIPEAQLDWVPIDAEHLMRVYDELVGSNGVTVLFGALFLSVNREVSRQRIESVNLATKGGVLTVRAKVFIDCTGDADVAVASGVGFSKGDDDTGSLQPATHCFVLSNVDTVAFRKINGANSFHSGQSKCVIHPIVESGQFPEIKEENEAYAGKRKEIPRYGPGESHGLPYRCLIPKDVDNLLVAGRSISVDRSVQGSIRVMPVCLSMGEAVGIASAMALTVDSAVRAIDTTALREKLKRHGAYLPDFVDGSEV